jgi:hypothetical protein
MLALSLRIAKVRTRRHDEQHLRMTENNRLATAAPAMKHRMMTLSKVLVLWLLPTEVMTSSGLELASVATAIVAVVPSAMRLGSFHIYKGVSSWGGAG